MEPTVSGILGKEVIEAEQPSKNYKMNISGESVSGFSDGLEAMRQVVYKILNTERYRNVIYSWNYGVELEDLFGQSIAFVCVELERRIKEALLQDDRVISVGKFEFDRGKRGVVLARFEVVTKFGVIEVEKGVVFS